MRSSIWEDRSSILKYTQEPDSLTTWLGVRDLWMKITKDLHWSAPAGFRVGCPTCTVLWTNIGSNWSLLRSKASKILYRHLLRVLSCSTPFQALTPKSQKEQNADDNNWDTFTFSKSSLPIHLGQKLEHGQARPTPGSQAIENRLLDWKQMHKN